MLRSISMVLVPVVSVPPYALEWVSAPHVKRLSLFVRVYVCFVLKFTRILPVLEDGSRMEDGMTG